MRRYMVFAVATLFITLMMTGASADVVTIDGSSADWTTPDTAHNDPQESTISNQWNIDRSLFEWDSLNDMLAFAFTTYDDLGDTGGDRVVFLIDSIKNAGSSYGPGLPATTDFVMEHALDGGTTMSLSAWNGSQFTVVSGAVLEGQRGGTGDEDFFEARVRAQDIGDPSVFYWGVFLDPLGTEEDDFSPDTFDQEGRVPEPATTVLFTLGLAGLAARRRRREA